MNIRKVVGMGILVVFGLIIPAFGGEGETGAAGTVPRFDIEASDLNLSRPARPHTYFDKAGRRFSILGYESGNFEAWAYPLKIIRGFEFSFLLGTSTVPIEGRDIVRFTSVEPAATTLTFTSQSFTVRAHYITDIHDPGAVILLEVDSIEPLTIVCSFLPVLQPMWPAGIGGQYAIWDEELRAYLISEPTRKNHAFVGSPAARGISYTPAHMLSDVPNQFKIEISDPSDVKNVFLPVVLAGGRGSRADIREVYRNLAADPERCYRQARDHYQALRQSTLQVETPHPKINLAFEWAKVALDNLIVENPDLGKGLVAGLGPSGTGGRPGFGWYFGGDAYLNSLSFNSIGYNEASRQALAFTQKWQREDGKMAHELSQAAAYIDWWKDYPYGYIHGDTTPYYIVAVHDYFRMTGDLEFIRESWSSLRKAYEWCLTTDSDGDGLMDNSRAGLGALEFGALTGIQTDIYLAAVWTRACQAMEHMADVVGDREVQRMSREMNRSASGSFAEKFWDAERKHYSYGFNKGGELVPELVPWSAVGIAWELGNPERSIETLIQMNSSDLTTDWGVRLLSDKSPLYEPLNYNYGAAWPFLTGWVSAALYRHNFILQGYHLLFSTVSHTFDNALGVIPELYSGHQNIWPQEGVPHQGFSSSGAVYPLVRGMLGLEGDAVEKLLVFNPRLPADWREVSITNFQVGNASFAVDYRREGSKIQAVVKTTDKGKYRMTFAPALGLGTKIRSASLNGKDHPFELGSSPLSQAVQPRVDFLVNGTDIIEFVIEPAPEILPPDNRTKTGALNRGLRIIKTAVDDSELVVFVEGMAGRKYTLDIESGNRIASVSGARFSEGRLEFEIPHGSPGEYQSHEIRIQLK